MPIIRNSRDIHELSLFGTKRQTIGKCIPPTNKQNPLDTGQEVYGVGPGDRGDTTSGIRLRREAGPLRREKADATFPSRGRLWTGDSSILARRQVHSENRLCDGQQKKKKLLLAASSFFGYLFRSDGQEDLHREDQAQHAGQDGNLLGLAGDELDDGAADQGQT